MLANSPADLLSQKILKRKFDIMGEGKSPRLVLLNEQDYNLLKEDWLKSYKELPWGDQIEYELSQREDKSRFFLADGTLHGLWVVIVETIEEFAIY